MKVPAVLLSLALATAVAAQGNPELPSCAQKCADQYLRGGIGNCGSDPKCICSNSAFIDSIACCLVGVCDAPAQTSAVVFASSLCRGFGVTTLPTAVNCPTASPTGAKTTGSGKSSTTTSDSGPTATGSATNSQASGSETSAAPTGGASDAAGSSAQSSSQSSNFGPRPTAAAGLGAVGGIVAALALL
ncbi:hypothetical protein QBC42DRAFT_14552 [Cladorrhinum samala]|uniref:CFEM domain-containing protein n=1 Tax=Cladorrhinum samala TaxID=585594 RepID=A0AAV9HGH7_9PEZI|nr:hypothetical protein QBC42DRAFT_14552 [Cladorrhinum samala]